VVKRENVERLFEKFLVMYQILLDPPKSPDKKGDFDPVPPFLRGASAVFSQRERLAPRGLPKWSDWRGLGGINKYLKSQQTTFQTPSKIETHILQI
jgi:hypothetical protein